MVKKRRQAINVLDYEIHFQNDGLNSANNFQLINFNYNITEIIQKSFEETERLDRPTITTFFKITARKVNNFNHLMDRFVLPYNDLPYNPQFIQLQKDMKYAKESNNNKLLKQLKIEMKLLMSKIHAEVIRRNDEKLKKKLAKEFKEFKLKEKAEFKVELNNHVDKKNFDRFFDGIKDLFITLFGT